MSTAPHTNMKDNSLGVGSPRSCSSYYSTSSDRQLHGLFIEFLTNGVHATRAVCHVNWGELMQPELVAIRMMLSLHMLTVPTSDGL